MSTKHTPGPWSKYVNKMNDVTIIKRFPDGQESHEVARCKSGFGDANLIAAAPELLESLQVVLRDFAAVYDIGDVEMQPAIYQARAAIQKATGEAS